MKKYRVLAPYVVFEIKDGEGGKKEYSLKKGDIVELPEDNITVRALGARGQIERIEEKDTPAKTTKK